MTTLTGPFAFEAPTVEGAVVRLPYRTGDGTSFTEVVELPVAAPDTPEVRAAVRVLHLAAGVSYYKALAPVPLDVPALSATERALVTALYDEGLREFAYRNGIPVPMPIDLVEAAGGTEVVPATAHGAGVLVPIGGGKDSALVASLLPDGELFAVNPVGAQRHLAEALGRPLLAATRTLDPALRALNEAGAPNGHVPVTAITSSISVLVAACLGLGEVAMGIERSADEPTVTTSDGVPVNHQFSKSWAAERLLAAAFAPTGVRYYSLLRPMTELAIGAAVARRGLAADIVSCNRVFTIWNENASSREQRPCGECAKCLFTALMLAPASTPEAIAAQYGRALLDEPAHIAPTRELWSDQKPFDCVGERHEPAAALGLLADDPAWAGQAVGAALADEARAVLGGADPTSFLDLGPLEVLPADRRDDLAVVAPDLAAVAAAHRAPR